MSSYRIDRGAALGHLAAAETLLEELGTVPGIIATLPANSSEEEADSVARKLEAAGAHALVAGGGVELDVSGPMLAAIAHALCAQVCLTEGQPRPESADSPEAERLAAEEDGPA